MNYTRIHYSDRHIDIIFQIALILLRCNFSSRKGDSQLLSLLIRTIELPISSPKHSQISPNTGNYFEPNSIHSTKTQKFKYFCSTHFDILDISYLTIIILSNPNGPDVMKSELPVEWKPIDQENYGRNIVIASDNTYMNNQFFGVIKQC